MPAPTVNSIRRSFGLFEMDLKTGELWKAGYRVKLQSQPFKVLATLVERPGEVVTREELQARVWGANTVGNFEHSLGIAINKIRDALGDSAESPIFVETLARRGYRFIAPVQGASGSPAASEATESNSPRTLESDAGTLQRPSAAPLIVTAVNSPERPNVTSPTPLARELPSGRRPWGVSARFLWSAAVLSLLLVGLIQLLTEWRHSSPEPPHIVQITHNDHLAPTIATMEGLIAGATDGSHLFAETINEGRPGLMAVSLKFGTTEPLALSDEVPGPALGDISPDGSSLLLRSHLSPESEQPLWVVPTVGGSAQRVGEVLAHDATWMPDGKGILYAAGNELYLTELGRGQPKIFARLPGRAFWLRWQPSGQLLRFTILDPIAHTTSLWQISERDRQPQRILTHSGGPSTGCCGVWTADGSGYVFQSTGSGTTDLWELSASTMENPVRLTDGPLAFQSPVAARAGRRIYFLGVDARSELKRVGPGGALVPEKGMLAPAVRIDFSRDRRWVAWTDGAGILWRARTDGSDKLQLTAEGLDVFLAHWSPDGTRLALMAREAGKAWQLYLIDARGGEVKPLLRESRNAADPSWSPDGQSIVFGRVNDYMGKESAVRDLEILHLGDDSISDVPDSAGLFSPRWSPDGQFICALTLDQQRVKVFEVASQKWSTLPVTSGADPVWSSDSRSLFVHASMDPHQPIVRIRLPEMKVQDVVQLAGAERNEPVDFVFVGLALDGTPLVRLRTYTGNIYSLDLRRE